MVLNVVLYLPKRILQLYSLAVGQPAVGCNVEVGAGCRSDQHGHLRSDSLFLCHNAVPWLRAGSGQMVAAVRNVPPPCVFVNLQRLHLMTSLHVLLQMTCTELGEVHRIFYLLLRVQTGRSLCMFCSPVFLIVTSLWLDYTCPQNSSPQLTPNSGVILEKLIVAQLIKKFPAFYGIMSLPKRDIGPYNEKAESILHLQV
jgi:hypothetical protein